MVVKAIKLMVAMVERLFGVTVNISFKPRLRIKHHPKAVGNGASMEFYVNIVKRLCNYTPENIFEIGANYAQDAEFLRRSFGLSAKDVYVFEPHPQIFSEMKNMYLFNAYEVAVSNENGRATFNAVNVESNEYGNSGISSLRKALLTDEKNFIRVDVEMIRMDHFLKQNKIDSIDFLKIDVEGMNYEVLEGLGACLQCVKAIQTEGEYKQYWHEQKTYYDMHNLLKDNGFKLVYFMLSNDGVQSDSLWVQDKYINQAI